MILLVGPSASGKTEVGKILNSKYGITKAITTTSRSPRVGEVDKVDYFFVTLKQFEELKNKDYFVENTFYNNNYYGCGKNQIQDNKYVILDPNGLKSFIGLNNKRIITFFLNTPENIRKDRMLYRGDPLAKVEERIITDRKVFLNIEKTDFVIENQNITLEEITDLIYKLYIEKLKQIEQ